MMTREKVLDYVSDVQAKHEGIGAPIYTIMVFEKADKELIGTNGKPLGWPDTGCSADMGFYYDIDTAIRAMHENWADIHETCYNAGFILCHFQGVYEASGPYARIFFRWDNDKGGYVEAEEPDLLKHIAY